MATSANPIMGKTEGTTLKLEKIKWRETRKKSLYFGGIQIAGIKVLEIETIIISFRNRNRQMEILSIAKKTKINQKLDELTIKFTEKRKIRSKICYKCKLKSSLQERNRKERIIISASPRIKWSNRKRALLSEIRGLKNKKESMVQMILIKYHLIKLKFLQLVFSLITLVIFSTDLLTYGCLSFTFHTVSFLHAFVSILDDK